MELETVRMSRLRDKLRQNKPFGKWEERSRGGQRIPNIPLAPLISKCDVFPSAPGLGLVYEVVPGMRWLMSESLLPVLENPSVHIITVLESKKLWCVCVCVNCEL